MTSVILIWLYMFLTTFTIGYGVLRVFTRHIPYHAYLICGMVCVTVYAQFFSLFAGVGLLANVILCIVCILIWWFDRVQFGETVRELMQENLQYRSLKFWGMIALFLLFAYGTSRGMIHYDTGLYHAQSIRWIEEYGVVKGLGNLHCRLAYNSSSFALSALYSMAFLNGGSYHCCAGFLAFILAAVCLETVDHMRAGKLHVSDFARAMAVYYLVNIFDRLRIILWY